MSKVITSSEFRDMMKKKGSVPKMDNPPDPPVRSKVAKKILSETPDELRKEVREYGNKQLSGISGRLTTKEALRAMGHYFELDEKSVKFFIKQITLNGKI